MSSREPARFQWLRIDANNNCNLKCTYCRVPRSTSVISHHDLESFLNRQVLSVRHLQFGCGMEPTLDSRLGDLMLMAAQTPARPSHQFVIQTNGTLLHQHDLGKFRDAGLNRISVSIDSLSPEIHALQRGGSNVQQILSNLKVFASACPEIEIQLICVVTSASLSSVPDLARFAADLGVKRMAFREMVYVANHPNTVDEEVLPLVISREQFFELRDQIQQVVGDQMELSFYTQDDLAEHRQTMRSGSYWESNADKPFLTPIRVPEPGEDLLAGKKFFALRGFMKSGTNWVGRLLNLHPEISCAGEFHWQAVTTPFIQFLDGSNLVAQKNGLRHEFWMRMDRMIKECLVLANHPDATWIGDRTPEHIAPSIILDSRIIHLVRDPRDVLVSRAYHFFNNANVFPRFAEKPEHQRRLRAFRSNPQYFIQQPQELLADREFVEESLHYWDETVRANRAQGDALPAERFLEIRYEDLHADIETERRRLYQFFGVDPELASPLSFNTQPGFEKEMPERFLRKGAVGDWKNYVDRELAQRIQAQVGESMKRWGYGPSPEWANEVQLEFSPRPSV